MPPVITSLTDALDALMGRMTVFPRGYVVRFDQAANEWCAIRCTDAGHPDHPATVFPHGYAASTQTVALDGERIGGWATKAQACEAVERLLASALAVAGAHAEDDDQDVISAMLSEGSPVAWSTAGGAQ